MRLGHIAWALLPLLAGCMGDAVVPAAAPPEAPPAMSILTVDVGECRGLCEPSVAVDPEGRLFVRTGGMYRSLDGGASWEAFAAPPVPLAAPPGAFHNDGLLQVAPDGSLWFSALLTSCVGAPVACSGVILWGIQVARSDDGGASWSLDTVIQPPQETRALGSDRQWLAFGPDGEVCASYLRAGAVLLFQPRVITATDTDILVACSQDGGRTFGGFASAPGGPTTRGLIGGAPSFDAEGRLFLPYFRYDEPGVHVARSDDGGRTFRSARVGTAGNYFPSLAVEPSGALHLVWKDADGAILGSTSVDAGETWSPEARINAADDVALSSPWAAWTAAGLGIAWHREGDGSAEAVFGVVGPDGTANATVLAVGIEPTGGRPVATDMAYFVVSRDGDAFVVAGVPGASTVLARIDL